MLKQLLKRLRGKQTKAQAVALGDPGSAAHSIIRVDGAGRRSEIRFGRTVYGKGHKPEEGHKTDTVIEVAEEKRLR